MARQKQPRFQEGPCSPRPQPGPRSQKGEARCREAGALTGARPARGFFPSSRPNVLALPRLRSVAPCGTAQSRSSPTSCHQVPQGAACRVEPEVTELLVNICHWTPHESKEKLSVVSLLPWQE